jgi:hypothetical protein
MHCYFVEHFTKQNRQDKFFYFMKHLKIFEVPFKYQIKNTSILIKVRGMARTNLRFNINLSFFIFKRKGYYLYLFYFHKLDSKYEIIKI